MYKYEYLYLGSFTIPQQVAIFLMIGIAISALLLHTIMWFLKPRGMDFHSYLIWKATKLSNKGVSLGPRDVRVARETPPLVLFEAGAGVKIPYSDYDSNFLKFKTLKSFISTLIHKYMPFSDDWRNYDSPDKLREAFLSVMDKEFFLGNHKWPKPTSDEALEKLCFQGLLAHRLNAIRVPRIKLTRDMLRNMMNSEDELMKEEVYAVYMNFMRKYQVRPNCAQPGGDVFFNEYGKVVRINIHGMDYFPGGPGWEAAKFHFRSSALLLVTLYDHFAHCHLTVANAAARATRGGKLPPTHPLRTLMQPFTFGTVEINSIGYDALFSNRGLFERASPFTTEGLQSLMLDAVMSYEFRTVPHDLKMRGMFDLAVSEDTPYLFGSDSLDLWATLREFVSEYVKTAKRCDPQDPHVKEWLKELNYAIPGFKVNTEVSREGLIDIITVILWNATGFHETAGNVKEYLREPTFMATRWLPGATYSTIQNMYQLAIVAVATSIPMPPLVDEENDYAHLFPAETFPIVQKFQNELRQFKKEIEERNAQLEYPLNTFNPKNLEISVSI